MKKFLHKNNNMKRIILIFLGLFSLAYGQFSNTGAKTRFVNGISIGTKLDSYFNVADSNAIYWRADSVVMAKYRGTARALSFIDDTAFLTNRFVRLQTGNLYRQTGKAWVSDTIYTSGVLRADSHLRTDSINSATLRMSGNIRLPNNRGIVLRRSDASTSTFLSLSPLDTFNVGVTDLPSVYAGSSVRFNILNLFSQDLQQRSGTIALTSNVTDSASALRASINTKLNISDTAAMLSGVSLDRVLANGNTSGRAATVGAFTATTGYFSSNLTSAARIRSDKAFFNSSSTTAFDTVLSVIGLSNAPGIVAVTSSGQAIRAVATGGATAVTARSDNINGNALDIINTAGGRLISANNGTTNVFTLDNNGKITTLDSIVGVNQRLTGTFNSSVNNNADFPNIIANISSGTSAFSTMYISNDGTGAGALAFGAVGTGNTIGGLFPQDGAVLYSGTNLSGGLSFGTRANAAARIYTNATLAQTWNADQSITALPTYSVTVGATNRDLFIDNTGLIGYVSSFRASKKNIAPLGSASWIHQLNPVKFNYRIKDSTGKYTDSTYKELEYGLIAEEVEPINKEMVFYDVDSTGKHLRGVHYSKLIIPLLKEIQDQKKTITDLEARVAKLEELIKLIKP